MAPRNAEMEEGDVRAFGGSEGVNEADGVRVSGAQTATNYWFMHPLLSLV